MRPSRVLAVDSGASHVSCGWFATTDSGRLTLSRYVCAPVSGGATNGFADLALGMPSAGRCLLSLSAGSVSLRIVRIPDLDRKKRGRLIAFEARQAFPWPLGEVAWDHAVLGREGGELNVLLGAARLEMLTGLHAAAVAAGFSPGGMEPGASAMYRCFDYNYPELAGVPCVLVQAGPRELLVMMVGEGSPALRTALVPAGNSPDDGMPGMDERLHLEIARVLAARRGSGAVRGVFLTGPAASQAGLGAWLEKRLGLPVEKLDPLRRVEVSGVEPGGAPDPDAPGLAALVGLAAPSGPAAVSLDLTPPLVKQAREAHRRRPWWLAAAAALALALVLPGWQARRATAVVRGQSAMIESQAAPLRVWKDRNALRAAELDQVLARLDALQGLEESRTAWVGLLHDLQVRIEPAGDVWLDALKVVRTRADESGGDLREAARPERQFMISGFLLNRSSGEDPGAELHARMQALLLNLAASPWLEALETERFDAVHPRLLRFDATFRMRSLPPPVMHEP